MSNSWIVNHNADWGTESSIDRIRNHYSQEIWRNDALSALGPGNLDSDAYFSALLIKGNEMKVGAVGSK